MISRGFTLIEMMVVVGIIVIITSIVLANNNRFGGEVLLQNLAYDMALSIREAQVYGISVQRFNGTFGSAYGMHFQLDSGSGSSAYILFADALTPADGLYECPQPGTSECELVDSTTISSGYRVSNLCATPSDGIERCSLPNLDITFKRPEPDAYIRTTQYTGLNGSGRIVVSSPKGDTENIVLNANGQVSVCARVDAAGECQ